MQPLEQRTLLSISPAMLAGPIDTAGNKWTYQITATTGETATYANSAVGPTTFNGIAVNEVDTNLPSGAYDKDYHGIDAAGDFVEYGSYQHTTLAQGDDSYVNQPYSIIYPASLTAMVPFTSSWTEYDTSVTTGIITTTPESQTQTLVSETTTSITVPAGTYDCYEVITTQPATHGTGSDGSSSDGSASTFTGYYSPGVGLVKAVNDGAVEVLTSFTRVNTKLAFTTPPATVAAGATFDKPIGVTIENADGSTKTDATDAVTLTLNRIGSAMGTLTGTATASASGGVATFGGLSVGRLGTYTLTAADAAGDKVTSDPFTVTGPVAVNTVLTGDSRSLSVTYTVTGAALAPGQFAAPFLVDVYRSPSATYTAGNASAVLVASFQVSGTDAAPGTHSITVAPQGSTSAVSLYTFSDADPFRPDPTHNYMVVTADQTGALTADDATVVPQGDFRFWLVGAVAHGYVGTIPAVLNSEVPTDFAGKYQTFVDTFAANLRTDGYDAAVPWHWEYEADRAIPNQPVQQGLLLEKAVVNAAVGLSVGANDVIDVNLIGWSRGTIVVNTALTALNNDATQPDPLRRGYVCETLVDPHPANNDISGFSVYSGSNPAVASASGAAGHGYIAFQTAVHDLRGVGFVIPPNVRAVSDMYQHNLAASCSGSEALLNLWGLAPRQITPNGVATIIDHQVTTPGVGHSGIMLDVEGQIIVANQTLQTLNLYPFGSSTASAAAEVAAVLATPASTPAAGDHLVVDALPPGMVVNGPFGLTVSVEGSSGAIDATYNGAVTLSLDALTGGTLGGTATATASGGIATFSGLAIPTAGPHQILAAGDGLASAASDWFTVTADRFVITTQPTNARVGQPFGLIVSAERADGSIDAGFTGTVTLDAFGEPTDAPATLGGTFARQAVAGTATFFGLTLPSAGDYAVTATAAGVAAGSTDGFAIYGPAATQLAFATSLSTVTVGAPFTLVIAAADAAGHLDASFAGTVTLSVTGPGTLGGTLTATASGGIATFAGLTLSTAGPGYTIAASGGGLTGSDAVTVAAAGVASQLRVAAPTTVAAGAPFTVTVSATDGFGTVDPTFAGSVTLSASVLGTPTTPGGTLTATAVAGVATFTGLTLSTASTGYSFSTTANGLATATPSAPMSVTAGPATQLVVDTPPALLAGAPFTADVRAEDAFGNLATNFTGTVTLAAAGQSLGSTVTAVVTNGVAALSGLTLPSTGAGTVLTAAAGSLSGTTTLPVIAPDELVVTAAPPGGVTIGSPFGLTVSAVGANGAVDAAFAGNVTVSLVDGAALGGTATVAAVNGAATFTDLTVASAGTHAITATADAGAGALATSAGIIASAASPAPSTLTPAFGKVKLPASAVASRPLAASFPLTVTSATALSGKYTVYLYADTGPTLDGSQVLLGTFPQSAKLKAGKGRTTTLKVKALPASMPAGTYHVLAEVVDASGATSLAATAQTIGVVAAVVTPSVAVTAATPTTLAAGKVVTVTLSLANTGTVDAAGAATITVGLSTDGTTAPAPLTTLHRGLTLRAGSKPTVLKFKVKVPVGTAAGSLFPYVTLAQAGRTVTAAATTAIAVS